MTIQILFATDPHDAMNSCELTEMDFDSILWFKSLAYVDADTLASLTDSSQIGTTPDFRQTPEYVEARKFINTLNL